LIDNHPVENVQVTFSPTFGKDLPFASGVTDAEGNYTLQAFTGSSTTDGAVVGEMRVSFTMSRTTKTKKKIPGDGKGEVKEEPGVPAKYHDNPLTFTVPPEGTSKANFELSSK
jgi:hypothetical protein